jgi:hypothetical protein
MKKADPIVGPFFFSIRDHLSLLEAFFVFLCLTLFRIVHRWSSFLPIPTFHNETLGDRQGEPLGEASGPTL